MRYLTLIAILTVFLQAAGTQANTGAYTMPTKIKEIKISDIAKAKSASNIRNPDLIIKVPIEIKNSVEGGRRYYQSTGNKIKNIVISCWISAPVKPTRTILPFRDMSKTIAIPFRFKRPLHPHSRYIYQCSTWLKLNNNHFKPAQLASDYFQKIVFRSGGSFISK